MAKFTLNFLDLPVDSAPTTDRYKKYFLDYDEVNWCAGSGGGSFVYQDDSGNRWSLVILQCKGRGISLMFNVHLAIEKVDQEFVSVANIDDMKNFCDTGDSIILPCGSFLDPTDAWLAVEDFILSPTSKSRRVDWVSSRDLLWPEM